MIRVLVMIAIAGFVLSVATLSAAFAIGGPEAIARGGWFLASGDWEDGYWGWAGHGHPHWREGGMSAASGPQITRTLPWSGADRLVVDLPADVRYVQATGPATVTVTGPQSVVAHVIVRDDSIRFDDRGGGWWANRLKIVVQAPNVTRFDLSGRNELSIEGYRQDRLSLDVSGAAEVTATGEADVIDLDISGSGDVDLGALKAKGAQVEISGAGDATIAPTDWAKLDISGMGDIRLLTHPPKLETDVSGAGTIRQGEAPAAPSPPQAKGAKL